MENKCCGDWNFRGSHAAREASTAHLGFYSSKILAQCDFEKTIYPPLGEPALAHDVAENAVVQAVQNGRGNAYAPSIGLPAAKKAVAEYLNRDLPKKLAPEDVFMTVGCKQAIELAVDLLAKPKANVLIPSPGWPWEVARCIYQKLEIRNHTFLPEKNFEIDFESVRKHADKHTFAIFIINPHNPHGNTYSRAHLNDLANLAKELGIMVVSDEVYRWTVFGNNPFVPMATFSDIVPVMTLGSISKGWCLPGWRTGWLALHDLDGVFKCTEVVSAAKEFLGITSKPPTVIQEAIPTILNETPKSFFDTRQSYLRDNAELAYSRLDDIPSLKCDFKPEACTFLWTKLILEKFRDINNDLDFCKMLAREENLVVLPGIAFGDRSGWVRHSIDMDTLTLNIAFDKLTDFCDRHTNFSLAMASSTTDGA
ncbi:cystine lyase CORI3-like [Brassica rapa]|uniref:cystine lyase CORI3-like n=1 Tax=Brassica campestris TaxID=3711 RepID=UPI0004F19C8A|nr:cystine lyase CORI3-like [Brassica rapa]